MKTYDAIILGAGPYGLSIAAHAKKQGVNFAIFGRPLALWKDHMPRGMWLRSRWWASSLSDPDKKYEISKYFSRIGKKPGDPPASTYWRNLDLGKQDPEAYYRPF